jgi:hypothetical protein
MTKLDSSIIHDNNRNIKRVVNLIASSVNLDNFTNQTKTLYNYWESNYGKYYQIPLDQYLLINQPIYPIYYATNFKTYLPEEPNQFGKDKSLAYDIPTSFGKILNQ